MNTSIIFSIVSLGCGFIFILYVTLSSVDLGICLLSLIAPDDNTRESVLTAVDGIWHANQTWLVILGAALFAGFPTFYSSVLSSMYMPFLALLVSLIMRGIALEYRHYAQVKQPWRILSGIGALAIILCLATILTQLLTQQLPGQTSPAFATLFPVITLLLVALSIFLGSFWLDHATPNKQAGLRQLLLFLLSIGGLATLILAWVLRFIIMSAPSMTPNLTAWLLTLGTIALIAVFMIVLRLQSRTLALPWALVLAGCVLLAFILSLEPNTMFYLQSLSRDASPAHTLTFQSILLVLVLPPLLYCNVLAYRHFGKQST